MATALKNLSTYDADNLPHAADLILGVVVADWNAEITHALYTACIDTLTTHGVPEENIHVVQVPGTFELPAAARIIGSRQKVDAVICLGCVIKGETKHDEYISNAVAQGLVNLSITTGLPYIFGVLTPNTHQQALDRAGGKHGNKGIEAAVTAIRMAHLYRHEPSRKPGIGFSR